MNKILLKKWPGLDSDKLQSSKQVHLRPQIHQIKSRSLDLSRLKGFVAKFLHLFLQFLPHVMVSGEKKKPCKNQNLSKALLSLAWGQPGDV